MHERLGKALCRWLFLTAALLILPPTVGLADSAPILAPVAAQDQPEWLEPRGLNVVDLVGLVPEEHLQDAIVTFSGYGLLQYESGSRQGPTVTVRVRVVPRYDGGGAGEPGTVFNCLGQAANFDQWPSGVPASHMRVFQGATEITQQVTHFRRFFESGRVWPSGSAEAVFRYPVQDLLNPVSFTQDGAVIVPANMGCAFYLPGRHTDLTAEFAFHVESRIRVTPLGSEQFWFHSYFGPGNVGRLDSLLRQMEERYGGIRHDKFDLHPPGVADYILVNYPPMPVDVYGNDSNFMLPSGGTYRLVAGLNQLSVDHINTMGLPLRGQWQDASQNENQAWLTFFGDANRIASPEYVLPAGIDYDPCMTNGGCGSDLLDKIYSATMPMTVHYYLVERTTGGLERIPLRQVGPAWSPPATVRRSTAHRTADVPADGPAIYLPFVRRYAPPPPDDPFGCPCGWFDADGRMLDYVAPP